jgi:hypothetical protein
VAADPHATTVWVRLACSFSLTRFAQIAFGCLLVGWMWRWR